MPDAWVNHADKQSEVHKPCFFTWLRFFARPFDATVAQVGCDVVPAARTHRKTIY